MTCKTAFTRTHLALDQIATSLSYKSEPMLLRENEKLLYHKYEFHINYIFAQQYQEVCCKEGCGALALAHLLIKEHVIILNTTFFLFNLDLRVLP